MSSTFFIPAVNMMGAVSLDEAMVAIANYGFRKALIVTDVGLARAGVAEKVVALLATQDIQSVVFDGAQPNPTQPLATLKRAWHSYATALAISSSPSAVARPMTAPRASPYARPMADRLPTTRAWTAPPSHKCHW